MHNVRSTVSDIDIYQYATTGTGICGSLYTVSFHIRKEVFLDKTFMIWFFSVLYM